MLLEKIVQKIRIQKPFHTFWIAMLLSVGISLLTAATMSILISGEIQSHLIAVGFVSPMVATSMIVAVLLHLVERLLEAECHSSRLLIKLRAINQRLTKEINERQLAEEEMLRHARLASLGTLAASVAHEINNPNNAIQFNADIVIDVWRDARPILHYYEEEYGPFSLGGIPSDEIQETVGRLLSGTLISSKRIKTIVENLKHMARNRDDKETYTPVDIRAVLQSAILILQHQIQKHTEHFTLRLGNHKLWVWGNSQQLEQVFINLIQNALHALPERQRGVEIEGRHDATQNSVFISVKDGGSGISEAHLKRLTKPFFTTKSHGTGLGLFITDTIIRHHKGEITFSSQPSHGTTVTIRLPTHAITTDEAAS